MNADLERLARAMGDVYETHGQRGNLRTHRPSDTLFLAMARALLVELRNPSEEMILDATDAWHKRPMEFLDDDIRHSFHAMIDSILSD